MEVTTWAARSSKGITLVKLEKLTGISKSTLNNIENGKVSPTVDQLEKIAEAIGVKINDLIKTEYLQCTTKKSKKRGDCTNFQDYGKGGNIQQRKKEMCYNPKEKGVVQVDYKEAIHQMVDKIQKTNQLKRIYKLVYYIYTKGGG